jgi:outer membrane immunogenic protein
MNKLLIAGVALAAASLGGRAFAADMPVRPLPPPVPIFSWTGCYVGLYIGDDTGRFDSNINVPTIRGGAAPAAGLVGPLTNDTHMSGFLGGGTAGCNYQVYNWVWGIEVDSGVTNKDGQDFLLPPFNPTYINQIHESWLGTARARLGYAVTDKWLWYVTGGGAWARVKETEWQSGNPFNTTVSTTQNVWGWTVGVGTEYSLGYGWSIKSEFLYVDLGTHTFLNPGFTLATAAPVDTRIRDYVFKFGMNYKLGGWGIGKAPAPVVARY